MIRYFCKFLFLNLLTEKKKKDKNRFQFGIFYLELVMKNLRFKILFCVFFYFYCPFCYTNFLLVWHFQMILLEGAKATTETVDALRTGASAMRAMHKAT